MTEMKKRIIASMLVVVMLVLALVSCGTYDFTEENLDEYVTFDYDAFVKGLGEIEIEEIKINEVSSDLKPYYKPFKSLEYFKNRYANHPIYEYKFIGVYNNEQMIALLACRIIEANGSKCIRVMDVLGRLYGNCYDSLKELLYAEDAEYIDIMNYGINKEVFLHTGFNELDVNGDLIIPNYFEPFEQRNVKIELAFKSQYDDYVAFKGDSDQDRPNII